MKLSIKQENFCNYYVECANASEAYRRAFSCEKMKPKTVWEKASALLNTSKVTARVKELQDEVKSTSDVTKERILHELSNIAFSSIADMHNTWIERKEFDLLSTQEKSAIKSISTKIMKKNIGTSEDPEIVDVEYVKVELNDKLKAIERICKMLGWDAPEKVNVTTGANDNSIVIQVIDKREDVINGNSND